MAFPPAEEKIKIVKTPQKPAARRKIFPELVPSSKIIKLIPNSCKSCTKSFKIR